MREISKIRVNEEDLILKDSKIRQSIANEFDISTKYNINDLVIYEGQLYKFISSHDAGVWNSEDVVPTTIDKVKKVLYYTSQVVSAQANGGQIMRIPSSGNNNNITVDTVVLSCTFEVPKRVMSNVTWESFNGYITFNGTVSEATTANVILGTKNN